MNCSTGKEVPFYEYLSDGKAKGLIVPGFQFFDRLHQPTDLEFLELVNACYREQVHTLEFDRFVDAHGREEGERRKAYYEIQFKRYMLQARGRPAYLGFGSARDGCVDAVHQVILNQLALVDAPLGAGNVNGAAESGYMGAINRAWAAARAQLGLSDQIAPTMHVPLALKGPKNDREARDATGTKGLVSPSQESFVTRTTGLQISGVNIGTVVGVPGLGTDEETSASRLGRQMGPECKTPYSTRPTGGIAPEYYMDSNSCGVWFYDGLLLHRRNQFIWGAGGTVAPDDLEDTWIIRIGSPEACRPSITVPDEFPVRVRGFETPHAAAQFMSWRSRQTYMTLKRVWGLFQPDDAYELATAVA